MKTLLLLALLSALGLILSCASAPKRVCVTLECGTVCCNDDGLLCPMCEEER